MKWYELHPGFVCRICHYKLEDKASYKEHLTLHKDKDRLICVLCDKVYSRQCLLQRHVITIVSKCD